MKVWACLLAALVGIQAVERLRLADGPHGCAGRLEVWHGGRWGTVCDDGWDLRDAAVACRALGCGGALAAPGGAFFGEGSGPVWLSELACLGSEGHLALCPHRGWKAHICSHEEDAGVVCAGQRVANSRDNSASPLDGDLWPGLSGELSPSPEEPPGTPAPRPAANPQNGTRKKGPRPPKQAKSTRAPLLTSGAPRQERLRLAGGPHRCAGRLEVWHGGRWGTVCDDGWDLQDAAVACRALGCGGPLAAPGGARFGPGAGPVWMDDVGCGGGEQALRDCPRSPWGRSNCDHSEDAGLVCTGLAPRLRLADGPHGCAGRLEVWHGGRWGSVCDDAWDLRDAAVACAELGCGRALAAPGGAFFGEGAGPILLDDLRCRGNETALRFCPSRPWGQHDCHHREDAGAVCDGVPLGSVPPTAPATDSNSSKPREPAARPPNPTAGRSPGTAGNSPAASPTAPPEPGPEAGSPALRLVAGPSRCAGRLEVWHAGRWGTVCDDGWDARDSAVVCRALGCGRPPPGQPDPAAGRFGWGAGPIWLDDVRCAGTEASLALCPAAPWGKHDCAHNEDVGVTCTGTPGLDTVSDPFSWSWLPGLGRDQDAWLPGEATKPSASVTPSALEKSTTKAPGKMPKSTKKWTPKNAKRPTTQPTSKPSRGPGSQRPPELTSPARTPLPTEAAPGRTSELPQRLSQDRPTSRPTAQVARGAPSRTTAAPSTQGPHGIASGAATQQTPRASLGPSAEPPEGPRDPAPTASGPGAAGPLRVRLADGPNRCAGRLEVWHAGRWGTVCDDSWDLRDAAVACWELGCGKVRPRVGKTHYGPGTGPIWVDDAGCQGSEASLRDCPSAPWGKHNCDHEEDVGLTCTGTDDDDYPPWTWDPTSGEDLAKGATTAAGRGSSRRPGVPSAATRLPDTGDQESSEASWTWHTPSGRGLTKGSPTVAEPGPTPTTGTIKSAGQPSPVPRAPGDRGSPRKSWPTAAGTSSLAPSATASASPEPPGPRLTSDSWPRLTPARASTGEVTSDPPASSATSDPPSLTTPDLAVSTRVSSVIPGVTPVLSPTPPPTWPQELTPEPSAPPEVPSLSPAAELTPEADTTPDLDAASSSDTVPEPSGSPDPSINSSAATAQPTAAPHPTVTPHPTMTSDPTASPHPGTSPPQPTAVPEVTTPDLTPTPPPAATTHSASTPNPTSIRVITTKSLPTSLDTELPTPTPVPTVKSSVYPQLTVTGAPHTPTSQALKLDPSAAPGSSFSRTSPALNVDPLPTEDLEPPRSQGPKWTPPPALTPPSAPSPSVTPDLHLPPAARPLDPPPPDRLTLGPSAGQVPGPLGPCVSPSPPLRVMACEPPALAELVTAVRAVSGQLQTLTRVLDQDRQERRALGLGLARLAEAAQGLGQLTEAVRRLAEVARPPSTPEPATTTPEEEERPLRGDV